MKKHVLAVINDQFFQHNAVFFVGSLAVAVVNYLYHPVLSRFMSVQNFGDLEALLATYAQIGILTGIFGRIVLNKVAHYAHPSYVHHSETALHTSLQQLYTFSLVIMISIVGVLLALRNYVVIMFHFQSYSSLLVLAALVICSVPGAFQISALQGAKKFSSTVSVNLLFAFGKLACAIILVLLGFSVSGAMLALVCAQLFTIIYTHKKSKQYFNMFRFAWPEWQTIKAEIPYAFLILCATGLVTTLYTSDLIFVKRFFSAHDAGLYSGISTISNILFFATSSIAGVLSPSITKHASFKHNHVTLLKALALSTSIGLCGLAVFYFFPHFVISLFIGSSYSGFSGYLPRISVMIFLVSLINIFVIYFLALRNYAITVIALLGIAVLGLSLAFFHSSITAIVDSFLYTSILILLLLIGYYLYYWYHHEAY